MLYSRITNYKVQNILKTEAKRLHTIQKFCLSLWFFDIETSTIMICTNYPGYWVRRYGENIKKIEEEIQKYEPSYKVALIDCNF